MKAMNENDLKERTKRFALQVVAFCESLPKDETSRILIRQLLRSGTSVGVNYRAVCRAKSTADFISKFGTVLEEADESAYWIELLIDAGKTRHTHMWGSEACHTTAALLQEANELVAISVSSINTARKRRNAD